MMGAKGLTFILAFFGVLFFVGIFSGNYYLLAPLIALGVGIGLMEGFHTSQTDD